MEYNTLIKKFPKFIYKSYDIVDEGDKLVIKYEFEIPGLNTYTPKTEIPKKEFKFKDVNSDFVRNIVFFIGMTEAISYFKITCSPQFVIKCGNLNEDQKKWYRKLFYLGLGEFRYRNNIEVNEEDFVSFEGLGNVIEQEEATDSSSLKGILIPVGGGKDSNVTMDILKPYKEESLAVSIGAKDVVKECCSVAGFNDKDIVEIYRIFPVELKNANDSGYLNGHTPFSAIVAFYTYLVSYLLGKKYVALSNEDSANQSNVEGVNINHQYSKTFEFEKDFREFADKYLKADVEYFSLLRPITEFQIAMLFAKQKEYHKVFKSCNVGSKQVPWIWCCDCPKCLFVYTILSPFLKKEELIDIFGEDLFEKESLKDTFVELCGFGEIKPFECVGTYEEVQYAVSEVIRQNEGKNLPYLVQYYKDNFELRDGDFRTYYNNQNFVPEEFSKLLKDKIEG